jgi:hypothetical protein
MRERSNLNNLIKDGVHVKVNRPRIPSKATLLHDGPVVLRKSKKHDIAIKTGFKT